MNKKDQKKPLIIANWKMNGSPSSSSKFAHKLAKLMNIDKDYYQLAICPPFSLLTTLSSALENSPILLGAQDCSFASENFGSFTGEISAFILQELGCKLVILGHAERRKFLHESNEIIRKKVSAAQRQNLSIVLCVGETGEELAKNQGQEVVKKQLLEALNTGITFKNLTIAYEPVWAIGSGQSASIDQIAQMVEFIYLTLTEQKIASLEFENPIKIVYGGSVKKNNTQELLAIPYIDGLLVGGASLDYEEFVEILAQCKG